MKKLVKVLPILMTVMMVFMAVSPVLATTGTDIGGVNVSPTTNAAGQKVQTAGNNILGIIQVVGTIAAVGILMVVGIKYMMGSAEQKAEYKKVMLPYIIGAVILFAASNLAALLYQFAQSATTGL